MGGDLAWIPPRRIAQFTAHRPAHSCFVAATHCRRRTAGGARIHHWPDVRKKLTLYAFDAATGKFGTPIYEDPKLSTVEAVPVAAHEPPRWYWSTLNPDA